MWKKVSILVLLGVGVHLGLLSATGNASEYADTPTEPADGIFIPKQLTLIENMPLYVIPNTLLNKPEGALGVPDLSVRSSNSEVPFLAGYLLSI